MYRIYPSTAAALVGEYIYFSARDYNALLRTNIVTQKTEYICKFDIEKCSEGLHSKAFSYKNSVWFVPLRGEYIAKFDVLKCEIEYIKVKDTYSVSGAIENYLCPDIRNEICVPKYYDAGMIENKKLYLVPTGARCLAIVDLETNEISKIDIGVDSNTELLGVAACYNAEIWIAPYVGEDIIIVDYMMGNVRRIKKPKGIKDYCGVSVTDKYFYITDSIHYLYYCDINGDKFNKIDINIKFKETRGNAVREMIVKEDRLYLLPLNSEMILIYNLKDGEILECKHYKDYKMGTISSVSSKEKFLIFLSYTEGYFYIMGKDDAYMILIEIDSTTLKKIVMENYDESEISNILHNGMNVISEEKMSLEFFLTYL